MTNLCIGYSQLTLGSLLQQYRKSSAGQDSVWGLTALNLLNSAGKSDAIPVEGYRWSVLLHGRSNPVAERFSAAWESRVRTESSCLATSYLRLWEAEKGLREGHSEDYPSIVHEVMRGSTCLDSSMHIDLHLALGVHYFFSKANDSAGHYYQRAAKMALSYGDSMQIFRSHINLGTYMNGLGMPQTAMGYFKTADRYHLAMDYSSQVILWNNMASLLRRDGTWELAGGFLTRIDPARLPPSSIQLLVACNLYDICTRGAMQMLAGCDTVVPFLKRARTQSPYYRYLIEARLYDEAMQNVGSAIATQRFRTALPELLTDTVLFWSAFGEFFMDWQRKGERIPLSASELASLESSVIQTDSDEDKSIYYAVLGRSWFLEGNFERAAQAWDLQERFQIRRMKESELKQIEDFQAAYRTDSLRQALILNEDKTALLAQNAKVYSYFMWLFLGFVIALIAWAISYYTYAHRRLRLLRKEELVNRQQEHLYKEKVDQISRERNIQSFLRNFQEVLIEKLGIWSKSLRKGYYSEADLNGFRDMSVEMHALLQAITKFKSEERIEPPTELFAGAIPELVSDPPLNMLEQKLLVLTHQGLTTKEVSAILGKSDRYINNVRSRVRQKLNIPSGQTLEGFMEQVIHARRT